VTHTVYGKIVPLFSEHMNPLKTCLIEHTHTHAIAKRTNTRVTNNTNASRETDGKTLTLTWPGGVKTSDT